MRVAGSSPLLSSLDWEELDLRVRAQQRNREVHTPVISTFRWWARRSHALVGEILDQAAAGSSEYCVGDPFSGGGTVAVEAARRGLDVFAQDLHPWAIAGIDASLRAIDVEELEQAAESLLTQLKPLRGSLYGTTCPQHGDASEVLTSFWVRLAQCPGCRRDIHLYPYSLLTRSSRAKDEPLAWWGCQSCGAVTEIAEGEERACAGCARPLPDKNVALLPGREATCPHGSCGEAFHPFGQAPRWKLALVQRRCGEGRGGRLHFGVPTEAERSQATAPSGATLPPLEERIPQGLETRVLRNCGFDAWADLYAPRQLRVLAAGIEAIDGLMASAPVRDRLKLALCGCAEMAGRVSRWDRYYPKAFEAVANHRFAVTGFSCETNLLADQGRGTLPRRLAHSVNAARWVAEEVSPALPLSRRSAAAKSARVDPGGIVLTLGSSERQRAKTDSIDLVLTDPPYFDDVQYAELGAVFLAWARTSGLVPRSASLDLSSEAVANSSRGTDVARYRELLTSIFTETHRTLTGDGRMILTYHNSDHKAWWALGSALREASFEVRALAVVHSENERDHAKRSKLAFNSDLVIECRPRSPHGKGCGEPEIVWKPEGTEAAELLAAGRAIAMMDEQENLDGFRDRFRRLRGPIHPQRISPREKNGNADGE